MIEYVFDRLETLLDIREIDHPSEAWIGRTLDVNFDAK